jgi:hypothetical protein
MKLLPIIAAVVVGLTVYVMISLMGVKFGQVIVRKDERANLPDSRFNVPDSLWPPTRGLMVNSSSILRRRLINRRKVYITYGENCCRASLLRACNAALVNAGMDECRAYNASVLDSDFRRRNEHIFSRVTGAGLWLWKPYIINRTLNEMADGEYLVYADAGAYFDGPVYPLLVLLETLDAIYRGVLVFGVGLPQRAYCKRDAFLRQRCDTSQCHDAGQVNGALSVWRRGEHALRVVEAWLRDCQDFQALSDLPSTLGQYDLPGFIAHRHDQALLTNVFTREGWAYDNTNGPALFMFRHDRDKS